MLATFYATVCNCVTCARNCVNPRQHNKIMKIFLFFTLVKLFAINFLRELVATPRNNNFHTIIPDQFCQLFRTIPLKAVTSEEVVKAGVAH